MDNYAKSYACCLLAVVGLIWGNAFSYFIALLGGWYYKVQIDLEIEK